MWKYVGLQVAKQYRNKLKSRQYDDHHTTGVKIQGKSLVASRATNFKILVALLKRL